MPVVEPVVEPKNDNEYIKLENTNAFQVLVVGINKTATRDWSEPDYLNKMLSESFCSYNIIDPSKYIECIAVYLDINNFAYPDVKVHVISESPEYIDEIMYIDVLPEYKIDELRNDFASLLNLDGEIIFGNAIVTRTKIPSTDELDKTNMWYIDITKENMEEMLNRRAGTSVILYDADNETFTESIVVGSLDKYAETFFGESQYTFKKMELGFLKHNVNVWYSENKYGSLDVFGNILPELARVDKMIVFTLWIENYRGNLSLDEFNKIKYLSKKLSNYDLPEKYLTDSYDHLKRLVIKNKYRILNTFYNMYKN